MALAGRKTTIERGVRVSRRRTLPERLLGILDYEALEYETGRDASSIRRTHAAFVESIRTVCMPHQPRATRRWLRELEDLLIDEDLLIRAVAETKADLAQQDRARGVGR